MTYDVTIKVEHLLKHQSALPVLAKTGCAFVVSAVESLDDAVLDRLDKGHTRSDFLQAGGPVTLLRATLSPTFVTFTPWTTRGAYLELLRTIRDLNLIGNVSPIQFAIRLLIPAGSRLLELDEVRALVADSFDAKALSYRWKHPDPSMDRLYADLQRLIKASEEKRLPREEVFGLIWQMASGDPRYRISIWRRVRQCLI